MKLREFVPLAARAAAALAVWHDGRGVHGRIRPDAVRRDAAGRVRIVDDPAWSPAPEYLAPEQAGWLCGGFDERSDLYALGVVFYRWVAGRLPFDTADPAEDRHLREQPVPLDDVVPGLPSTVAEIVLRLLARRPGERYQTARGLATDLDRCDRLWTAHGRIEPFLLGAHDVDGHLRVRMTTYGRRAAASRLNAALERVAATGEARLVCVTGDPGVGKSALVAAFADDVTAAGGRVAAGAFDARAAPYTTVARVLAGLGERVMVGPDRAGWRSRLATALGPGVDALVDLAPELAGVFGAYAVPPATADPGGRLYLAVRRFLAAFGEPGRPLVLVLDDLQWSDPASADLLGRVLSDPDSRHLLVVASHRRTDPGGTPAVTAMLRQLGRQGLTSSVALRPLPDSALAELLADALHTSVEQAKRLVPVVAARTGSQPLRTEQFLHSLVVRGTLSFQPEWPGWAWSPDAVSQAPVAEDVAASVRDRIDRFTPGLRRLLQVAALLGDRFDGPLLAAVAGQAPADLATMLLPAVRQHLLLRHPGRHAPVYRWGHDEIRRAVLATVPGDDVLPLRRDIGRALLRQPPGKQDAARLYDMLDHLNAASALISSPEERLRLAELNLAAGRRAGRGGAPAAALAYLAAGLALLPAAAWREEYELALALHVEAARAANLAGERGRAQRLLDAAMAHTGADLGRAQLLRMQARLPREAGGWSADVEPGMRALSLLGVDLPADPARWPAAAEYAVAAMQRRLSGLRIEDVTGAPAMTDLASIAAANLIAELLPSERSRDPHWLALLTTKGVELALDHGLLDATGVTFAHHGAMLAGRLGDEAGAWCLDVALRLLDERPAPEFAARTRTLLGLCLPPWCRSVAGAVELFREGYLAAVEQGDAAYVKAAWILYHMHLFASGAPLDQVAGEIAAVWRYLEQHEEDGLAWAANRVMDEAVSSLRGVPGAAPPPTPAETATARLSLQGRLGIAASLNLTRALTTAYILGDYPRALALVAVIGRIEPHERGRFTMAEQYFYEALTLAAAYHDAAPEQQREWSTRLATLQAALDRAAAQGPVAFGCQALLVSAERARLAGDTERAVGQLFRAIGIAREHGFSHAEAIAAEVGARYALGRGEQPAALAYLHRARLCYAKWGAQRKVDQLDETLAALGVARPAGAVDRLDLITVVRAFQSIAGELDPDKLQATVVELLVEHTGVERGCLLLPGPDGTLRLATEARVHGEHVRVSHRPHADLAAHLPVAVVEHTRVTGRLVTGGSADLREFAADPYLAAYQPPSLLSAPMSHRDRLVAVLYLEHRRVPGAFTAAHVDLLEVLCAQAAVSLDNATSHARLVEANQVFNATFDNLPVGVVLLDPHLNVRRAAPPAVEIAGLPIRPGVPLADLMAALAATDAAGRPLNVASEPAAVGGDTPVRHDPVIRPPGDTPDRHDLVIRPPGDTPVRHDLVIRPPGGADRHVTITLSAVRDSGGVLLGVTLTITPGP